MRQLTKHFGTYAIAKYEKATGKGIMDLLDIGNFEVNRLVNIIKLGNSDIQTDEDAYNILDNYLSADDNHSIITAYFDLIEELDHDIKIMKSCGIKIEDLKAEFNSMAANLGQKFNDNIASVESVKA